MDVFGHNLPCALSNIFVTGTVSWNAINILKILQNLYWVNQNLAKQFLCLSPFLLFHCPTHFPTPCPRKIFKRIIWKMDYKLLWEDKDICSGVSVKCLFIMEGSCDCGVTGHASVPGKGLLTFLFMREFCCSFNGLRIWEKWDVHKT